jgi:hypothetical protein
MIQPAAVPVNATSVHCHRCMLARRLLLLVVAIFMLASCGDADSPEQQVRRVIGQLDKAVEERDTSALARHISAEYRDQNGMSREEAVRHVRGLFIARHSLQLMPIVEQVEFPLPDEARARVQVILLAGSGDAAGNNWDQEAGQYEFKFALRREDGDWKVTFAEWRRR